MVIDTSALVALLLDEPERTAFAAAIEAGPKLLVFAATVVEAGIGSRRGWPAWGDANLGDCFAYGLAVAAAEPLVFKGDDFRRTDVLPAI